MDLLYLRRFAENYAVCMPLHVGNSVQLSLHMYVELQLSAIFNDYLSVLVLWLKLAFVCAVSARLREYY